MRETDIRPDVLMVEQAKRFERDIGWLWDQSSRFVSVSCPACDLVWAEAAWRKHGFSWSRCLRCETVYMTPRPDLKLLAEYYQRSEQYAYWNEMIFPASEPARMKIAQQRAVHLVEISDERETLLDVGAGFGTFAEAADYYFDVVALEPEPHLAQSCFDRGLTVIAEPFEDAELPHFDIITAFEVIEHLFSPRKFLKRCAEVLPTDGLLCLTCPNVKGFEIEVLGAKSKAIDPEHLNLFHLASLAMALSNAGFEVIESETPGRLDCELVGVRDDGLQDWLVANRRSSHMQITARKR